MRQPELSHRSRELQLTEIPAKALQRISAQMSSWSTRHCSPANTFLPDDVRC